MVNSKASFWLRILSGTGFVAILLLNVQWGAGVKAATVRKADAKSLVCFWRTLYCPSTGKTSWACQQNGTGQYCFPCGEVNSFCPGN